MKNHNLSQIPDGFRDRFFESAEKKRRIEFQIEKIFKKNGYSPVILPTVEYSSVFLQGLGEENLNRMFQFFDSQGNLLALRADPTCSLARLVCTKLSSRSLPLSLFYITSVFRKGEPFAGKLNEFTQAGAELIGTNSIEADFEAISLALEILESFDSLSYQINMSHSGFIDGFLSEMALEQESYKALYELLRNRQKAELEKHLERIPLSPEKRTFLSELQGMIGGGQILEHACSLDLNDLSRQALCYLKQINAMLEKYRSNVVFDMGLVKKFDYYTGIIFKIFARQSRFPVGGGGRYDRMLKKFGRDLPAVGFSLIVDRFEEVL